MDTGIPDHHLGLNYKEFLSTLTQKRAVKNYLEIGVEAGDLLSKVHVENAYAVDPKFTIEANIAKNKKTVTLHQMTSDEFFADSDRSRKIGNLDFAFLDGLHAFEFLLRDFFNTEKLSNPRTLIALHDCLPVNEFMAYRSPAVAFESGQTSLYPGAWAGDVWKIVPILQEYRPDLTLVCVDAPPTGLVFVTNLDANNNVLRDNYLEIVKKYHAIANRAPQIAGMYETIEIVNTADILNEFDHTLFFRS